MKRLNKGLLTTFILSVFFVLYFYGAMVGDLGKTYFGIGGDGLLSYYNTLYHMKYDSGFIHQANMNYPYGDISFFTNNFMLISGPMQWIKDYAHSTEIMLWIYNLFMLLSFILGSVILYKIFEKLNLPPTYSALAAVGIAFLSPQVARLPSHFYLTYLYVIPLTFYLLMLFHERKEIKISTFLGSFVFIISIFQFYYFALIGSVVMSFWFFLLLIDKNYRRFRLVSLHLLIQLVLPFILIKVWTGMCDHITDRTNNPWGYNYYISCWQSVFLPNNLPLSEYTVKWFPASERAWEGLAFIGMVALFMSVVFSLLFIKKIIKRNFKTMLKVSDNDILNIFLWTGILTLFFSFGYPFKGRLEGLLDYVNIVKQIRSLGRFAWIFYYAINIIAFYKIYQWTNRIKESDRGLILVFVFFFLFMDAFSMNNGMLNNLNNRIPELEDKKNETPYNQWLQGFDASKYQAILPLPYFHIGSESIWYESNSQYNTYIISLKTGLPVTAMHSSRVSLSQTYKNMAMVLEPYKALEILKDYPNKKPLLIISQDGSLNSYEKNLVSKAKFIINNGTFSVYELPFEALEHISDGLGRRAIQEVDTLRIYSHGNFLTTDAEKNFVYRNFDTLSSDIVYRGTGALKAKANQKQLIYEGGIPNFKKEIYTISFWLYDIRKDLIARSIIDIEYISNGNVYYTDNLSAFRMIKTLDRGWALLESNFISDDPNLKIRVYLSNKVPGDPYIYIDELLIKPEKNNVYRKAGDEIYKNNRFYSIH